MCRSELLRDEPPVWRSSSSERFASVTPSGRDSPLCNMDRREVATWEAKGCVFRLSTHFINVMERHPLPTPNPPRTPLLCILYAIKFFLLSYHSVLRLTSNFFKCMCILAPADCMQRWAAVIKKTPSGW